MQNKPNFPRFSPKNDDLTKKQTQTNPIQTQFSVIIKGVKPIQTQNEPNFGPKTRINYENKSHQTH
jgi:hypothetical protein